VQLIAQFRLCERSGDRPACILLAARDMRSSEWTRFYAGALIGPSGWFLPPPCGDNKVLNFDDYGDNGSGAVFHTRTTPQRLALQQQKCQEEGLNAESNSINGLASLTDLESPMSDIFLSYASANRDWVARLANALATQGWTVWWDRNIPIGQSFDQVIEREINAARAVCVIWSAEAVSSEWVLDEANEGKKRNILFPVIMDDAPLPFGFRRVQTADLRGWKGQMEHPEFQSLLRSLGDFLGRPQALPFQTVKEGVEQREDPIEMRSPAAGNSLVGVTSRVKIDAETVHGAPNGWFKPGTGLAEWFKDFRSGPEMVVVPEGFFMMGLRDGEEGGDDERPQHKVIISKPFAVGRYAVSFEEWDAFVGDTSRWSPEDLGWGRGQQPVVGVNWDDAKQYVKWLKTKTGKEYRLLSEAEWEYVCLAGSVGPFWWGSLISTDQANYCGDGTFGGGPRGVFRKQTVPVNTFKPNTWGLYQVHGNVSEWVEDSWHPNYDDAPVDGSPWKSDEEAYHVVRGGSWNDYPWCLRASYRQSRWKRTDKVGLRVAMTL
jgi:formylglycine-generating enzyme required for sulfatase activity